MSLTLTSTIVWPSFLPLPLRDSYGFTPDLLKAETDVDNGPPLARQVFTDGPATAKVSFFMTPLQWQFFRAFWRYDLGNGAAWFQLSQDTCGEVVTHDCKFVGAYSEQLVGARNRQVTATLMVRQIDDIDGALYFAISNYGPIFQVTENVVNSQVSTQ